MLLYGFYQGCGSGSGLDPDSVTLWIRIRIGNPDPEARKLRIFSGKNSLLSYYAGIFLFDLTQILISNKFEKEIVFESSVLAWIRNRIRIEQKCWIRIRIKSIRIHNPGFYL
jgi:hypothetical protein